jgi:beta-glucosidase
MNTSSASAKAPPSFLWGVSTSAYQIEGAAHEDGRGLSIWDTYSRIPGKIKNNDTGDVACDHYHRYREDVALMQEFGVQAYRFSVAWPRIMPEGRGAINKAGLAFYDRLIDGILAAGIEPWLCLYHWDLPQALQDHGGWPNRDCAQWFADYTDVVAQHYGDRVKRFATVNEPSVFTLFGFALGGQAPGIVDRAMLLRAIHHVNLGHGAAIDRLRARVKNASLGAVYNCQPCRPAIDTPENRVAAETLDAYWNLAFPDPQLRGVYPPPIADLMTPYLKSDDLKHINRPADWFGLNHYSPNYVVASDKTPLGLWFGDAPANVPRSTMGWPVEPAAFGEILTRMHKRYGLPIYVTENGTAYADKPTPQGKVHDEPRISYLKAYTAAMYEAMAAGVDVRGYFVWALLDNFEWSSGYSERFGLVYVDYPTQRRLPKDSFRWFSDQIKASRASSVPTV